MINIDVTHAKKLLIQRHRFAHFLSKLTSQCPFNPSVHLEKTTAYTP